MESFGPLFAGRMIAGKTGPWHNFQVKSNSCTMHNQYVTDLCSIVIKAIVKSYVCPGLLSDN